MKAKSTANNTTSGLTIALFIIYLVALFWILILKLGVHFSYMFERRTNLIPFSITPVLTGENILNVIIFIPSGIYAGVLFKRWMAVKKLLFIFSLSLLVEVFQYIFRIGIFDVTDIITNTAGGVFGLLLWKGFEKAFSNPVKAQQSINTIAVTGTVIMIVLLGLLKMNMLPVRYQ